jgi:hypothetical protein
MNEKQLAAIRERCEAATEWVTDHDLDGCAINGMVPDWLYSNARIARKSITSYKRDIPLLLAEVERLRGLVEFAYCEGYEDSKDFEQHWSNSASRARMEGEA